MNLSRPRPSQAPYQRARRAKLKQAGVCVVCATATARAGHTTCTPCASHQSVVKRQWYAANKPRLAAARWDRTTGILPPMEVGCCGVFHAVTAPCGVCGQVSPLAQEVPHVA
jgi:hypothetical protein